MKKKTVGVLLSIALCFSLFGCGNSAEPKQETEQEEQQEETETDSDEKQADNREYEEFEYFFSTNKLDLDNMIPCNTDDLSPNGIYCGNWELSGSVDLYASRQGEACKIGYTKENIPVNVFNSSDEWIMLFFENEESPNNYRLIKVDDFLANSNYSEDGMSRAEELAYSFEIKDEYTTSEARNVFENTLRKAGLTSEFSKFSGIDDSYIMFAIPTEKTYEWAEEKRDAFLELGATVYNCEGYGEYEFGPYVKFQLMVDDKALSSEELQELFNSDVDIEIRRLVEEEQERLMQEYFEEIKKQKEQN